MRQTGSDMSIVINNMTFSYSDEGPTDAPVIIFIHGFPLNKSMWSGQRETLRNECRIITYDVRGHGNSEAGDKEFSIDLFAHDLIDLLNALDIGKAVVAGLSMGGYIALNAIINYPGRFEALILCDTNCIADTAETKEKRFNAISDIMENGMEDYMNESIRNLFAAESLASRPDEIMAVRQMISNTSEITLFDTLRALASRNETCSRLTNIEVPVLILVGEEDVIAPPSAARQMHDKIRDCRLHIIKHAGHLSNMDNPYDFNDQILNFVRAVCPNSLTQ